MSKLVLVNSDNFEHALMTETAYRELTLQMSSGDFGSHKHVKFTPSEADLKYFLPTEPVYDYFIDEDTGEGHFIADYCFKDFLPVSKKKKQLAEIISISKGRRKELTPRERLLKNQRQLFQVEAKVVSILSYKSKSKRSA